jgi:hypothetical protein
MKRIFLLFLVFVCATASAQVYRRIGPDGEVYFTDQPLPDAEQIKVTPAQAISMPPVGGQTETTAQPGSEAAGQPEEEAAAYSLFSIISPASEEAVRANDGNVTIHLLLQPELAPDHTIKLKVDGEDGNDMNTVDATTIELTNMSRGRHTVEATVVDDKGNELIQTSSVSFDVLRVAR